MADNGISRQTTVATVLNGMRYDILMGKYNEKCRISEVELSNKYQVSRSSVRTALQMLERDGLINIQPNGRKMVTPVDQKYINDLCQTRSILECEAVRLILEQDVMDLSELIRITGQFQRALQEQDDKERGKLLSEINTQFHDQLFILADNKALIQCWNSLSPVCTALLEINSTLPLSMNEHEFYTSHLKIVTMLETRDENIIEFIRYHAYEASMKDALVAIEKSKEM